MAALQFDATLQYGKAIKRAAFNLCSAQAKVLLRTLLSRSREECAKEEEQQQREEEEEEEEERRSDSSSSRSRKLEEARMSRRPQDPGTQGH